MPAYDEIPRPIGLEADRTARPEDEARWVMSFIDRSDREVRQPMLPIWQETLENYLVSPPWAGANLMGLVQYPYLTGQDLRGGKNGYSMLKDPESHQVVETLLAEQMILLFGEQAFMRTRPVGYEDATKSTVTNALLRYVFRREGHYRSIYEWFKDGHIFGTGIMEGGWHYEEQDQEVRTVEVVDGIEVTDEQVVEGVPVYDDYRMRPKDLMDFYPDTSGTRIADMQGVACRFTTTAMDARDMVERGMWDKEAVDKAIRNKTTEDSREKTDKGWRQGLDRPQTDKPHPDLMPLVGYRYYGNVPYRHSDGGRRRVVVVLAGEMVSTKRYFGRFPFFEYSVCPIQGRFYGISPLETIRFTQSFADSLLMATMDGAARAVYAQPIVDRHADVKLGDLVKRSPDKPVLADRVDAVGYLKYDPPLQHAQVSYGSAKQQMREGAGALGSLQGLSDGPDRESATGFAGRFKQAKGRPEAQAQLAEREYLPPLAQHALSECRKYLDGPGLALRVGEDPAAVPLATILEEYDVEFVGSRIEGGRAERLQSYREIFAQAANPIAAPLLPWDKMYQRFLKDLALYEEAAEVGKTILMNLLMAQASAAAAGGPPQLGGNGNGEQSALPPSGLAPAQLQGGPVV